MRLMQVLLLVCLSTLLQISVAAEVVAVKKPLAAVAGSNQAVLTIVHAGKTVRLSLVDIERLPLYQTRLKTQWGMNGIFQGVLMSDLMKAYQFGDAKRLKISALDNYASTLTKSEFEASPAFLATRLDGKPIALDNKGPLILLWPAKEEDALAGKATMSSWVWSISSIEAK